MQKSTIISKNKLRDSQKINKLNFEKTIGNTTYKVNAHFSETGKEDMVKKVENLLTGY